MRQEFSSRTLRGRGRSRLIHGILAAVFTVSSVVAAPLEVVEDERKRDAGITWKTFSEGLGLVRAEYRPSLVWYTGDGVRNAPHFLEDYLSHRTVGTLLRHYVPIRIATADLKRVYAVEATTEEPRENAPKAAEKDTEKDTGKDTEKDTEKEPQKGAAPVQKDVGQPAPQPDPREVPPSVGEKWRLFEGPAVFLVLDFRERIVRRFEVGEDPPRYSRVKKDLLSIAKRNAYHAKQAIRVEGILDRSEADYRGRKVREAVRKVLEFDGANERKKFDAVLRRRVEELLARYREGAERQFQKAAKFVAIGEKDLPRRSQLYTHAIKVYEKVAEDFPFRDVIERSNRERSSLVAFLIGGVR